MYVTPPPPTHHATFAQAGMCWNLMFQVAFEVIVSFLWQHITCRIICSTKSGSHLRLTFSNPYWRRLFSQYLQHCHASWAQLWNGAIQIYWLIDWRNVTRLTSSQNSCLELKITIILVAGVRVGFPIYSWNVHIPPLTTAMANSQ